MESPPKWLANGYFALFISMPWSVEIGLGSWNLTFPSEPLLIILGIGLFGWFWQKPEAIKRTLFSTPFLLISFAYLSWMGISACFSSIPIVSWKYWIVEVGHWWVFAWGLTAFPSLWQRGLPWFSYSMGALAVYVLCHHAFYHFRVDQALLAPMPFFPDHTMWAAALVMVLFLLLPGLALNVPTRILFLLLLTALLFSTCRAAWVSVLVTGMVWAFLLLARKSRMIVLFALLIGTILGGLLLETMPVRDVSALERINRWNCALRMAQAQPFVGFGPGTFQFQYIDFQRPEEMTRISLQLPTVERGPDTYGRGGGAHSEYLRTLAEMGWPGLLTWLGILGAVGLAGLNIPQRRLFSRTKQVEALYCWLALLSFFIHASVNEFMHDGRLAFLIWGCMAIFFSKRSE